MKKKKIVICKIYEHTRDALNLEAVKRKKTQPEILEEWSKKIKIKVY